MNVALWIFILSTNKSKRIIPYVKRVILDFHNYLGFLVCLNIYIYIWMYPNLWISSMCYEINSTYPIFFLFALTGQTFGVYPPSSSSTLEYLSTGRTLKKKLILKVLLLLQDRKLIRLVMSAFILPQSPYGGSFVNIQANIIRCLLLLYYNKSSGW